MILLEKPLDFYIQKLKNNEYFSLGMYGDGEWQAIFNAAFGDRFTENCEGTKYTKELSEAMLESLKFKSPNFYFAAPDTFQKVPSYKVYERQIDKLLLEREINIEFHEKNVWNKAMCDAELGPLIKQLRKMDVVFIGNEALLGLDFLNMKKFIPLGYPNCYLDGTLAQAEREAIAYGKPAVYIIAVGIPATLLVQSLHNKIPNSFFIDMGSIWDTFVGIGAQRPTRRHLYSHPEEYKEWRNKNLKDI